MASAETTSPALSKVMLFPKTASRLTVSPFGYVVTLIAWRISSSFATVACPTRDQDATKCTYGTSERTITISRGDVGVPNTDNGWQLHMLLLYMILRSMNLGASRRIERVLRTRPPMYSIWRQGSMFVGIQHQRFALDIMVARLYSQQCFEMFGGCEELKPTHSYSSRLQSPCMLRHCCPKRG